VTTRRQFLRQAAAGLALAGCSPELRAPPPPPKPTGAPLPGGFYNILLVVTDQERYHLPRPPELTLPARERLRAEGVSFERHYTASAMCTSARSALFTGRHVQHTRMFDNIEFPLVQSLAPALPTLGGLMTAAGYATAYKGRWSLTRSLEPDGRTNFARALQPYGFSEWASDGDYGRQLDGYYQDEGIVADAAAWLRRQGQAANTAGRPWFLTVALVNPHDVTYVDTDPPGQRVQANAVSSHFIVKPPADLAYRRRWNALLPRTLGQPLAAPGRPAAHAEYVTAWGGYLGRIPADRPDMWQTFTDFYLNSLRQSDSHLMTLLETLDRLALRPRTIVVLTSDHGELGGAHGGMLGTGPTAYEENIHVPLVIAHPAEFGGRSCHALTSHVDLAPTLVGLTPLPTGRRRAVIGSLPGHNLAFLLPEPQSAELNAARPATLFCYSGLQCLDRGYLAQAVRNRLAGTPDPSLRPDFAKRGTQRTVFDGRFKFSRYFAPSQHHTPTSWASLREYNDLELYDLEADPDELVNLALDTEGARDLILIMNGKLNRLIAEEVGDDVGQELPGAPGSWILS
jgi:arylsulfatase A-like enzyme